MPDSGGRRDASDEITSPARQGRRHRGPPGRWNGVPPVRLEATTLEAGEGFPVEERTPA